MGTTPPNDSAPDLVEALVARVDEIDAQLRATTAAIDEKSLKEFRRTVEVLEKRDAKFEQRLSNKVSVVADRGMVLISANRMGTDTRERG